jgi:hypothetical protein
LADLAHHFFWAASAGEASKAMAYAEEAGREALNLLAYEEAARLFRMALAALELSKTSDERRRCRLLLALGDALGRAGDVEAAKNEFIRAADIAHRDAMPEELGLAALGYGDRFTFTRGASDHRTIALLEDAPGSASQTMAGPFWRASWAAWPPRCATRLTVNLATSSAGRRSNSPELSMTHLLWPLPLLHVAALYSGPMSRRNSWRSPRS